MRRPFFRSSNLSWYVELPSGKQVCLGRDERFKSPPKEKPKEPPRSVQQEYLSIMQRQGGPEDRTFRFCVDEYLRSLEVCPEKTQKRARYFLERFLGETGDMLISKLRRHHITSFLKDKKWKPNSVHAFLARIGACLNYCEREDWIPKNPLRGKMQMPTVERRAEIMSAEDRGRVLEEATGCFREVLLFLTGTGCRPIELRYARVEKVDLDKSVIMVRNKTRKKTGSQERAVFLSSSVIGLCRELIGERKEGWLLQNHFGNQWTQTALEHRLQKLCDKLKITYGATLYSFRHRWASEAINDRHMNPAMVAIQLGHTDLKMLLKTYLHSDHEAMRKALDE
jgi:integrase